jgi:hypothetical protein
VQVWDRSERRRKVGKLRWFLVDEPRGGWERIYFQVTCGGKFNPWYYTADEIRPLERRAAARKPRRRSSPARTRRTRA